jgi:hypothetical protein
LRTSETKKYLALIPMARLIAAMRDPVQGLPGKPSCLAASVALTGFSGWCVCGFDTMFVFEFWKAGVHAHFQYVRSSECRVVFFGHNLGDLIDAPDGLLIEA